MNHGFKQHSQSQKKYTKLSLVRVEEETPFKNDVTFFSAESRT